MLARVSNIESFRRWRLTDEPPEVLVARLTDFQPTEAMLAGTAFHYALETAQEGSYGVLSAHGYTFLLETDCELALAPIRELRCFKQYGPLKVTGQVDALIGTRVEDHKTTALFNADGYLEGCQWRFYLDIFDADIFRWNVFELVAAKKPKTYIVKPPHRLEQVRYPGLHADCNRLAADFCEFASKHLTPQEQAA